ncbi:hypothetical protein, partial [Mesorhizobium sp. L2C067A000]|uniref:hypothetical protein n=1 Tax=Mesorhizobium sp. L2C067A000 TaxID=1287106 RepID=UPI0005182B6D
HGKWKCVILPIHYERCEHFSTYSAYGAHIRNQRTAAAGYTVPGLGGKRPFEQGINVENPHRLAII